MEAINYTIGLLSNDFYHEFLEKFSFSRELKLIGEKLGYLNWMATIISQKNSYGRYFDYPVAREQVLQSGDVIKMGDSIFIFEQ